MKNALCITLILFATTLSSAATGKDVSYKSGDDTVNAVLTRRRAQARSRDWW